MINAGLKEIGEPEVTSFTATNILQQRLIEVANNSVRGMVDRLDYDWLYKRTTISTTAVVTTGAVSVTNGSTTINSVNSSGGAATNFVSTMAGTWFRVGATQKSYKIASFTSTSVMELETEYLDTTNTAASYRIFKDTFGITDADFDVGSLTMAAYGDSGTWTAGISGYQENNEIGLVSMPRLYQHSGGDPHRDTSGRPVVIAPQLADSSNDPQFTLWPYPTDTFLIELWYIAFFAENVTFATALFGGSAPQSAYDYVEHKVVAAAHKWDEAFDQAAVAEQEAQTSFQNVIRRENRERMDTGLTVETYRRHYGINYPTSSNITFNTVRRR